MKRIHYHIQKRNLLKEEKKTTIIDHNKKVGHFKNYQVLGPYCSGTNLLEKIFKSIVPRTKRVCYKHCNEQNIVQCVENNPKTLFICSYRPFYSWVMSKDLHTYSLFDETINIHNLNSPFTRDFKNIVSKPTRFQSVYDFYNRYLTLFHTISKYPNVIVLHYHKVIEKEKSFDYIHQKLKKVNLESLLSSSELQFTLHRPSKPHGNPVSNSKEAVLKNLKYKQQYDGKYEKFLNTNLVTFFENQ